MTTQPPMRLLVCSISHGLVSSIDRLDLHLKSYKQVLGLFQCPAWFDDSSMKIRIRSFGLP